MKKIASILLLLGPAVCFANPWWRVVAAQEVTAVDTSLILNVTYDANDLTDSSTYGNDGVLVGAATVANQALQTTNSVSMSAISNVVGYVASEGTMASWVRMDDSDIGRIMEFRHSTPDRVMLYTTAAIGLRGFYQGNNSFIQTSPYAFSMFVDTNVHMALTWSATDNEMNLYFNGILYETVSGVTPHADLPFQFYVSNNQNQAQQISGSYDATRVYSRALVSNEIHSLAQKAHNLP